MNSILRQAPQLRALGILALLCLGSAAPAAAGVITEATSYVVVPHTGDVYQITYGYNWPAFTGVGTYNLNTLPNCGYDGVSCSGSETGTQDTSGLLNASFDQTSASGVGGDSYNVSSSASAVANLAAGTIGVAGSGTAYQNVGANGSAFALADDVLHFTVAAGSNPVTDIGVSFEIDGTYSADASPGYGNLSVDSYLFFGNADTRALIAWFNQPQGPPIVGVGTTDGGWVSAGFVSETPNDILFEGTYALTTGAVTNLPLQIQMSASCGEGNSCSYDHTGAVSLSLPSSVTFTSDSRVFLTETPEPESIWLMAAGLIGFLAVRRLRAPLQG